MKVDKQFSEVFGGKLHQVFVYLIDKCNLSCVQCLYKPHLNFQLSREMIPYDEAKSLIKTLHAHGATKITLMGGEPTLYPKLPELIKYAKDIGYSYIRIDTNGMFPTPILEEPNMQLLDEITFSLDGYDCDINDPVRGKGVFEKCTNNINEAVKLGYRVQVTCCIHDKLTKIDNGKLGLIRMIEFAESMGIQQVNFHDLLKMNIPRDTWTGDISPSPEEYSIAINTIMNYIENNKEKSSFIRFPQRLISSQIFNENSEYYGYCSGKESDRLLVFPDGTMRICSLLIGSPYYVATYDHDGIYWNSSVTNETIKYKNKRNTACAMSRTSKNSEKLIPLCIAFKPNQDEPIWNYQLKWENKRE